MPYEIIFKWHEAFNLLIVYHDINPLNLLVAVKKIIEFFKFAVQQALILNCYPLRPTGSTVNLKKCIEVVRKESSLTNSHVFEIRFPRPSL